MNTSDFAWIDAKRQSYFIKILFTKGLKQYFDKYINTYYKDDLPYFYQERTLVGHLVRAAAECNYFTAEQYGQKEKEGDNKTRYPDLWVGKGNDNYIIEVKIVGQRYYSMDGPREETIKATLSEAETQGRKYFQSNYQVQRYKFVSLAFIRIVITCNNNYLLPKDKYNKTVVSWISKDSIPYYKKANVTFRYVYMLNHKYLRVQEENKGYFIYPGFIAVGRISRKLVS